MLLFVFHLSKFPHILWCFNVKKCRIQCTFTCNIGALSPNNFCRGKAVSVRYSEGVPIPLAARYKPWVCGRRLLGMQVWILPSVQMSVSCECCVVSGRGLCDGLITRPEESYRVCCVWVWSWSLDNEEALGPQGLFCHLKKQICTFVCTVSCPAFKAHAPYYIITCVLFGCNFSTLFHKQHDLHT